MAQSGQTDELDRHRARLWALLGALLARSPGRDLLNGLAGLRGDDSPIGAALNGLAAAAAATDPTRALKEFNRLFIGVERGEVVPYASYYITGFLADRPLVEVRGDMARLGIARAPATAEPEDHIASLSEMMAGLIDGSIGPPEEQRRFFDRHLARWAARFFQDLENAASAELYAPVGRLGRLFVEVERQAFAFDPLPRGDQDNRNNQVQPDRGTDGRKAADAAHA